LATTAASCELALFKRIASGLEALVRMPSAFEIIVMSSTLARARTDCIASVTGLFHPSITTTAPAEMSSFAFAMPIAGVLSSSRTSTSTGRPSTPPSALIIEAMAWMQFVTS
jgi:hypothetical protein